jgi:hypothetical protein
MRIHFVTFATPAFRGRQLLLNWSARFFGEVDQFHAWSESRLVEDGFMERHPELFPNSKGFGWYAWKPYIILQALRHADEGDLVIYQDVGRRDPVLISRSLRAWNQLLTEKNQSCISGVLIPDFGPNKFWTKRSAFEDLKLTGDKFENSPQIQASWSVWRKCTDTENFVREWAELCQKLDLVGGILPHGLVGEIPGFKEHRWDQSILTLLSLCYNMPIFHCSNMRSIELNEKSIDNFNLNPKQHFAFYLFLWIVRFYYFSEKIVKMLFGGFKRKNL